MKSRPGCRVKQKTGHSRDHRPVLGRRDSVERQHPARRFRAMPDARFVGN